MTEITEFLPSIAATMNPGEEKSIPGNFDTDDMHKRVEVFDACHRHGLTLAAWKPREIVVYKQHKPKEQRP